MKADEIKKAFKILANDDLMTDSVAGQTGVRDLYYAADKYGEVSTDDFKAAMIRYFARCGYNSQKSAEKLAALEVYTRKGRPSEVDMYFSGMGDI